MSGSLKRTAAAARPEPSRFRPSLGGRPALWWIAPSTDCRTRLEPRASNSWA